MLKRVLVLRHSWRDTLRRSEKSYAVREVDHFKGLIGTHVSKLVDPVGPANLPHPMEKPPGPPITGWEG